MQVLNQELAGRFREIIYNKSSLTFPPSRLKKLEGRLRERMARQGLRSFEDYYDLLAGDAEEFSRLIEGVTTKETYFFRIPGHFKALAEEVIPSLEEGLISEAHERMMNGGAPGAWKIPLSIWSAGCSTGEEAYSIAMTVHDSLKYPNAWKAEVMATDISQDALAAARLGVYSAGALRQIPERLHRCAVRQNDEIMMNQRLRRMIQFRDFNLRDLESSGRSRDFRGRFHVIFCRNVMIYFDLEAQQRLVDALDDCLRPGGFLFLGDAELLHLHRHRFQVRDRGGALYYRKPID